MESSRLCENSANECISNSNAFEIRLQVLVSHDYLHKTDLTINP